MEVLISLGILSVGMLALSAAEKTMNATKDCAVDWGLVNGEKRKLQNSSGKPKAGKPGHEVVRRSS